MAKFKLENGKIYSFPEGKEAEMAVFMEKNAGKFEPVSETEELSKEDENVAQVRADNFVAQNYSTEDDAAEYNKLDVGSEDFVIDYEKKINPNNLRDQAYYDEEDQKKIEANSELNSASMASWIRSRTSELIDDVRDAASSDDEQIAIDSKDQDRLDRVKEYNEIALANLTKAEKEAYDKDPEAGKAMVMEKAKELYIREGKSAIIQDNYEEYLESLSSEEKEAIEVRAKLAESSLKESSKKSIGEMEVLDTTLRSNQKKMQDLVEGEYTSQEQVEKAKAEMKKLQENQKQTYNQFQHANSKFEVELNTQADLSEWADMSGRNYNFIPNLTGKLAASTIDLTAGIIDAVGAIQELPMKMLESALPAELAGVPQAMGPLGMVAFAGLNPTGRRRLTSWMRNGSELIRSGLEKPQSFSGDNDFEEWGEWALDFTASQGPQIALMVVAPQVSLPIMTASAFGSKFNDLEKENEAFRKAGLPEYTVAQMYGTATMSAGAEYLSEKVTLGQLKRVKLGIKATNKVKGGFGKYLKDNVFNVKSLKRGLYDPLEEGGTEVLAGIGDKWADKFILGKENVNLLEGATEAFVGGAFMSGVLFKAPSLGNAMLKPFRTTSLDAKFDANATQIMNLSKQLQVPDINQKTKDIVQAKIDELVVANNEIKVETAMATDLLSKDQKQDLINNHNTQFKNDTFINTIMNDSTMSQAEKEAATRDTKIANKGLKDSRDAIMAPVIEQQYQRTFDNVQEMAKNVEGLDPLIEVEDGVDADGNEISGQDAVNQKIQESNDAKTKQALAKPENEGKSVDELVDNGSLELQQEVETTADSPGTIIQNPDGSQSIVINKTLALKDGQVNVAGHEFLHAVLNQTVKDNPAVQKELGKSVTDYLSTINPASIQNSEFAGRLKQYQAAAADPNSEITEADAYEETMTLLLDAIATKDVTLKQGFLTKLGNNFSNMFKKQGLNRSFNSGKDVVNFIQDFGKEISQGKLSESSTTIANKGAKGKLIKVAKIKAEAKAKSKASLSRLFEGKRNMVTDTKILQNSEVKNMVSKVAKSAVNKYYRGIPSNISAEAGVSESLYRDSAESYMQEIALQWNPAKATFDSFMANRGMQRLNSLAKTLGIPSTVEYGGPGAKVSLDDAFQIASDTKLADELLDDKLNNKNAPPTSQFRQDLGLSPKDNSDLINEIEAATETSFFENMANVTSPKFVKQLAVSFFEYLNKPVGRLLGNGNSYLEVDGNGKLVGGFVKTMFNQAVLPNANIASLVAMERLNDTKIFAVPVRRLTKQKEIDAARDKGLLYTANDKSGPMLYRKLKPSDAQLVEFFNPPAVNPVTGQKSNNKGNRKTALKGVIITTLGLDMAPQVTSELLDASILPDVNEAIQRDPKLKFSLNASTAQSLSQASRDLTPSQKDIYSSNIPQFISAIASGMDVASAFNSTYGPLLNINDVKKANLVNAWEAVNANSENNLKVFNDTSPKKTTQQDYLHEVFAEQTNREFVKDLLGLKDYTNSEGKVERAADFNSKEQLDGMTNSLRGIVQSLRDSGLTEAQVSDIIVNQYGSTFSGESKVGTGKLAWKKIDGNWTLTPSGKSATALRYNLFANVKQMADVLGVKYVKPRPKVGQTKTPYLNNIRKNNGKLSSETLTKSADYAKSNKDALFNMLDWYKNLSPQDKAIHKNSMGMLMQSSFSGTKSMVREAAAVNSIAGTDFNKTDGEYRYEHNPPARVMTIYAAQYLTDNMTKPQLESKFDGFGVTIIPKSMDDVINVNYQDTTPLGDYGRFGRYYNPSNIGQFPFVTTLYTENNGKWETKTYGDLAPKQYEIEQSRKKLDNIKDKIKEKNKAQQKKSLTKPSMSQDINKKDLSQDINKMIEDTKGIESQKVYSDIVAKRRGAGFKGVKLVAAGAQDFNGLMYDLYGRGKKGEQQQKWVKDNLVKPYQNGVNAIDNYRQALKSDYASLLKKFPNVRKKLGKTIPGTDFTYDQALRVNLWTKAGYEIPGISKRDAKKLNDTVNNDPELLLFNDAALLVSKEAKWVEPSPHWDVESLISDLNNLTEKVGRKKFLAEFIENSKIVFSKDNLNKMEVALGSNWREAMEDSLYRMENGTNRPSGSNKLTNNFLNWVNNSIGAIMFFNRKSALLQTISSVNFLNWSDNNPLKAAMALANFPQYLKDFATLWNSPKLKQRRSGLRKDVNEAELANAAKGAKNKPQAILSYLLKLGFTPTQLADSFAIASGGATFYRNRLNTYKKQGMSETDAANKAFEDFSETSDVSQQSADPMLISQQQASILGRLLLAFQNTPAQVARIFNKASRDFINNRGDQKTNMSKMIYYGAIQGFIFAALQNALFAIIPGFDDEEDEEKKDRQSDQKAERIVNSMADTMLRGSGIHGAIVATLKNTIMTYYREEGKDAFTKDHRNTLLEALNLSPPIGSKLRKINNAIKTKEYSSDIIEEQGWDTTTDDKFNLSPSYNVIASLTEALTNLPLERMLIEINGIVEALDARNTAFQRVALALGYRTWDVNAKNEEFDQIRVEVKQNKKEAQKQKVIDDREERKRIEEAKRFEGKTEDEVKMIKRKDVVFDQTRSEQITALLDLGLTKKEIKALKYEDDRVNKIIELQDK